MTFVVVDLEPPDSWWTASLEERSGVVGPDGVGPIDARHAVVGDRGHDYPGYVVVDATAAFHDLVRTGFGAANGAWVVEPPERIAAGDEGRFWLQDPPRRVAGSDGWATYVRVDGEGTPVEGLDPIELRFACPTVGTNLCSGWSTFATRSGAIPGRPAHRPLGPPLLRRLRGALSAADPDEGQAVSEAGLEGLRCTELHQTHGGPMSRPSLPFDLPLDRIRVTPWHDPVVEAVGYDPRSPYVERFWLALLGPSTTLLLRRVAAALEVSPDGFDLDLDETARAIGLGMRAGANGPFLRAIGPHRAVPPLPTGRSGRHRRADAHLGPHPPPARAVAPSLQAEHDEWVRAAPEEPTAEERWTRARRLAEPARAGRGARGRRGAAPPLEGDLGHGPRGLCWARRARAGPTPSSPPPTARPPLGPQAVAGIGTRRPRPATGSADDAA
ncbi:MAG: hypothetical protein R2711_14025 [Acidimicrobiales bacterium]